MHPNKSKENSRIVLEIDNEKCLDPKKVATKIANYFLTVAANLVKKIPIIAKKFDVESQIFKDYYRNKGIIPKSFKMSKVTEILYTKNYVI